MLRQFLNGKNVTKRVELFNYIYRTNKVRYSTSNNKQKLTKKNEAVSDEWISMWEKSKESKELIKNSLFYQEMKNDSFSPSLEDVEDDFIDIDDEALLEAWDSELHGLKPFRENEIAEMEKYYESSLERMYMEEKKPHIPLNGPQNLYFSNNTERSLDTKKLSAQLLEFTKTGADEFMVDHMRKQHRVEIGMNEEEIITNEERESLLDLMNDLDADENEDLDLLKVLELNNIVPNELEERQRKLEREAVINARKRFEIAFQGAIDRNQGSALPPGQQLLRQWIDGIKSDIQTLQTACQTSTHLSPFLKDIAPSIISLDPRKLSVIAIHLTVGLCLKEREMLFGRLANEIGDAVLAEINAQKINEAHPKYLSKIAKDSRYTYFINKFSSKIFPEEQWTTTQKLQLGAALIDIVIRHAYIIDKEGNREPAFQHTIEYKKNIFDIDGEYHDTIKKYGKIKATENFLEYFKDEQTNIENTLPARHLPMLVKPKPWISYNRGGYLENPAKIMRTKGSITQNIALQNTQWIGRIQSIQEGLNILNTTAWRVNKKVFDVFEQVWTGEEYKNGIADLPSRNDIELPPKPETDDVLELIQWKKQFEKIKQLNRDLHSLRCDTNYKLEVARTFLNDEFYFPHNVDFRGRSYPIPPHLNHLGADINRGLLMFSEGRPITKKGIEWLKIHLANLCGYDKLPFEGRLKFVDDNMDEIVDSAKNPLTGKKWWLTSENPWQTLAACFELVECLESPKPEEYISHIPIQMDGSCNGLQHYAALGRDNLGALHVNLLPTERPMDVYSSVLNVVLKYIDNDAKEGNEIAKMLRGNVFRSTIKQTVMTSVYGVTFVGAKKQIQRKLKERQEISDDALHLCSQYLARITLQSLGEVFKSAQAIMDWLNECAYLIASAGEPVCWITPLGLPVVQPYRSSRSKQIKTVLQSVTIVDNSDQLPISRDRQKSAFPPNYVHSLDASHMFMCAKKAHARNIVFASVHDSFWTHACDTDELNELIRESFVELHSQPLLETLHQSFQSRYPDIKFPPVPPKGSLNLLRVKEAKYFFD